MSMQTFNFWAAFLLISFLSVSVLSFPANPDDAGNYESAKTSHDAIGDSPKQPYVHQQDNNIELSTSEPTAPVVIDDGYGVIGGSYYEYEIAALGDPHSNGSEVVVPSKSDEEFNNNDQTVYETLGSVRAETAEEVSNCTALAECFNHEECGGGKARCIGIFVGKCNCNACISGLPCKSDAACGGLKHACAKSGFCHCIAGHLANGFASFGVALTELCNVKSCDKENSAEKCFGLPCHAGHCAC